MELLLLLLMAVGSATFMTGSEDVATDTGDPSEIPEDAAETESFENADGDPLTGDGRHDLIVGTEEDDAILGRKGNDVLQGRGGNDTIGGGAGDDRIDGEDGNDEIVGNAGNDTLIGGQGSDTLDGGEGRDLLEGRWGDDSLFGGVGDDTLDGDQGIDTLDGGEGNDTIILNGTDTGRGGEGSDEFRLQTGSDADMMIVSDYTETDDRIVVEYDAEAPEPIVGISDEDADSFVTLNGIRIAQIQGAAGTLTAADIALVASGS